MVALFQNPINSTNEIGSLFLLFSRLIEKKLNKKSYSEKLELTNTIIENTHEAIWIADIQAPIIDVNKVFSKIIGYQIVEVRGKTPKLLQSGHHDNNVYQSMWNNLNIKGHWQGGIRNKRKSSEMFPKWLSISAIHNKKHQVAHYVSFLSDITEQNEDKIKSNVNATLIC